MAQDLDRRRRELERQIADQEESIRRMIERGTPSQAAEDRLRQLKERLAQAEDGR
jgi:uncharacterized coiled-coil protein SlyX